MKRYASMLGLSALLGGNIEKPSKNSLKPYYRKQEGRFLNQRQKRKRARQMNRPL